MHLKVINDSHFSIRNYYCFHLTTQNTKKLKTVINTMTKAAKNDFRTMENEVRITKNNIKTSQCNVRNTGLPPGNDKLS